MFSFSGPSAPASLLVLVVFLAFPNNTVDAKGKPDRNDLNIMLLGSSTFNHSLGRMMERDLKSLGYDVRRLVKSASGFSRPDYFDWQKKINKVKAIRDMDVVVVYLGGNDAQCLPLMDGERGAITKGGKRKWLCMKSDRYDKVYKARVVRFLERLCDLGVRKVVLLPPVDVVSKRLQKRLKRIRKLQLKAAAQVECASAIGTGGDFKNFVRKPGTRRELRFKDGVHATHKGSIVVWDRIRPKLYRVLKSAGG